MTKNTAATVAVLTMIVGALLAMMVLEAKIGHERQAHHDAQHDLRTAKLVAGAWNWHWIKKSFAPTR